MGQNTDGQLPSDALGFRADGIYVPGVGTVAQQGTLGGTDAAGTNYGIQTVQLASGSVTALNGSGIAGSLPLIVQKNKAVSTSGVASLTCAFASNITAGNSIVVVCGIGDGTTATITDTLTNTYTLAVNGANSTTFSAQIFYAVNSTGGANTVTVTPDASVSVAVEIYEVSGLIAQAANVLAQQTSGAGTSTTPSASNIASPSPNALAFMGVAVGTAAQAVTATASTFWTLDSSQNVAGTPSGLFTFGALSQPFGSLASVTPKATIAGSEPWAVAAAAFRPVSLPVSGTVRLSGYNFTNITTKTTTTCKTGPGLLHGIMINKAGSADTLTIYDNTAASGTLIGTITVTASVNFFFAYDADVTTGITVVSGGTTAGDYTVLWK